jgi:hypothetical protein
VSRILNEVQGKVFSNCAVRYVAKSLLSATVKFEDNEVCKIARSAFGNGFPSEKLSLCFFIEEICEDLSFLKLLTLKSFWS